MRRTTNTAWVLLAGVAVLCAATAGQAARRPRNKANPYPVGYDQVEIRWGKDWQDTFESNSARWKEQLATEVPNTSLRAHRLRLRQVRLLEAMLERYRPTGEDRLAAIERIVRLLDESRLYSSANRYRLMLVDEFPGQWADVARWLAHVVGSGLDEHPSQRQASAARRLLALHEAGAAPGGSEAVLAAWRTRFYYALSRERLPEARAAWRALRERTNEDEDGWLEIHRAGLLVAAARVREARDRLAEVVDDDSPRKLQYVAREARKYSPTAPPVFPRRMDLAAAWDALASAEEVVRPMRADEVLAALSGGESLVAVAGDRYTSSWQAVMGWLGDQPPSVRKALRQMHDRAAADLDTGAAPRPAAALAAFRRYPLAAKAHRGLLAAAWEQLRRGRAGPAAASFGDVVALAAEANGEIAREARVGLWLALAQRDDTRGDLARAVTAVSPQTALPWQGRSIPAGDLARMLLANDTAPKPSSPSAGSKATPPRPAPDLARLQPQWLTPTACAWNPGQWEELPASFLRRVPLPHGQLEACPAGVLWIGPNAVALYPPGEARRAWVRTCGPPNRWVGYLGERPGAAVIPGLVRPACDANTLYCRWSLVSPSGQPTAVAAMDLADGRMRWLADEAVLGRGQQPVSHVALADGRLYVLLANTRVEVNTPLSLACLDAARGELLWRRPLANQSVTITASRWPTGSRPVDLVRYGSSLAVHAGEVYVNTSMGFAARCDARDGQIVWTRSYSRATTYQKPWSLIRRQTTPPQVLGERVVFLPRDLPGAFALDRRTGRLLWDNPFLPADAVVDATSESLLLHDDRDLCLARADTGEAVWTRQFGEPLLARARPAGESVLVATASALWRVSARTGAVRQRLPWPTFAPHDFLVRGDRLVGIASGPHTPDNELAATGDPKPAAKPGLPMAGGVRLSLPAGRILPAPPGADTGDLLWLHATGVLSCVRVGPPAKVVWQTPIPPGADEVTWMGKLLVGRYADSLCAWDPHTGRLRWHRGDVPLAGWFHGPGWLVLAPDDAPTSAELVAPATGRTLWARDFARDLPRGSLHLGVVDAKDDRVLLFFVNASRAGQSCIATCRRTDAAVLAVTPLPLPVRSRSKNLVLAGGVIRYVGADQKLHEVRLDAPDRPMVYDQTIPNKNLWPPLSLRELDVLGPWMRVTFSQSNKGGETLSYFFRRGQADYAMALPRPGRIEGDRLYDFHLNTLSVIDLATKQPVAKYTMTGLYRAEMLTFRAEGKTLYTVSWAQASKYDRPRLRVDAFDRDTAKPIAHQWLDMAYWADLDTDSPWYRPTVRVQPSVAWVAGRLVVTGPWGVGVFWPVESLPPAPLPLLACRAAKPVVLDGSPAEWDHGAACKLDGPSGGRVMLAHDDGKLLLAVACPDTQGTVARGHGPRAAGDRLTVALDGDKDALQFTVGTGADGRVRIRGRSNADAPTGAEAAMGLDVATGTMVYELAVPWALFASDPTLPQRHPGLSLAVWDDRPAAGRANRPTWWLGGGAEGGRIRLWRHRRLQALPRTPAQERARLALARAVPELETSREFLRNYFRRRFSGGEPYGEPAAALLRPWAHSPGAADVLALLDQALRRRDRDPVETVLALAERAGFSPAARQQYKAMTTASLSTWAWVPSGPPRHMVLLRLNDGREGHAGWGHAVYWGYGAYREGQSHTPSRQCGGWMLPEAERDQWHQFRVPLIWLDMQDRPIYGIGWGGMGQVVFDRTALHVAGKEIVLADDDLPEGELKGEPVWVTDRTHSGRRAWRAGKKTGYYSNSLSVTGLAKPITAHLTGPPRPAGPADAPRAAEAIRRAIPALDYSEDGWELFQELLALQGESADRATLLAWFVQANPHSPDVRKALAELRTALVKARDERWREKLHAVMRQAHLSPKTIYEFALSYVAPDYAPLKQWQVLGPLPKADPARTGREPIETRPVQLNRRYPGLDGGQAAWREYKATDAVVNLGAAMPNVANTTAYAVCWIHSPKARQAMLEFGSDDLGVVWLNGRLVLKFQGNGPPRPRQTRAPVTLREGWNELLIRITEDTGGWGFYAEFLQPDASGPPEGLKVSSQPPK